MHCQAEMFPSHIFANENSGIDGRGSVQVYSNSRMSNIPWRVITPNHH